MLLERMIVMPIKILTENFIFSARIYPGLYDGRKFSTDKKKKKRTKLDIHASGYVGMYVYLHDTAVMCVRI